MGRSGGQLTLAEGLHMHKDFGLQRHVRELSPGRPGLVIAGRLWTPPLRQCRAGRPMGARRAGQIGPMRLPPGTRNHLLLSWRNVHGMVEPAMPRRRNRRGLSQAVVDHPAALETKVWVDLPAARAEIAIAEFVLTHELAIEVGPDLRAEGPTVPPCEEAQQEIHRARHDSSWARCPGLAPSLASRCGLPRNVAGRRIAPHTGAPMLETRAVGQRDTEKPARPSTVQ